jgi:hypothetical protein
VMVSSIANFSPLNTHDSTFFPLGAAGRDIFLASVGPIASDSLLALRYAHRGHYVHSRERTRDTEHRVR